MPRFYHREQLPELFGLDTRCALEWEALVIGALTLARIDEEFFVGDGAAAALWLYEAASRIGIQVAIVKGAAESGEGRMVRHAWLAYYCGEKAVTFDPWNEVFGSEDGYGHRQGKIVRPKDAVPFHALPNFEGDDAEDLEEVEWSMREVF